MERMYVCPTCGSTKTIMKHPTQTASEFLNQLPDRIICGVRSCLDYAVIPKVSNG